MKRAIHCWAGRKEEIEREFGWHSAEHIATYDPDWQDGICMLEDGHTGPHVFTPTDEIIVRLPDGDAEMREGP